MKNLAQDHKDFIISQICKIRKASGNMETLKDSDFKIANLRKIYSDLTEEQDLYMEI